MSTGQSFIERQNERTAQQIELEDSNERQTNVCQRLIRDRRVRLFTLFLLFTLAVPILIFYFVFDQTDYESDYSYTCSIDASYRVSCGDVNITQERCIKINCCYDFYPEGCYHSIPSRYSYRQARNPNAGDNVFHPSQLQTPFYNNSLPELKLSLNEISVDKLQIILHTPTSSYHNLPVENKKYNFKIQKDPAGVEVFRAGTEELILTTLRGPLIASDGYWEWTFQLLSEKLYGLGELVMTNKTITKVIYKNRNDHTTIPSFMAYLNGSFHGVVVEHDGPLEVTVLPSRLIILRSLAETKIVLNLCTGPTPQEVVKQQRLNEFTPPPYWVLGAHICRWDTHNKFRKSDYGLARIREIDFSENGKIHFATPSVFDTVLRDGSATIDSAIKEYKAFIENEDTIQFDSDCIHENLYAMLHEATGEHDLENLIRELQAKSHFLMSVPPQILTANSRLYKKAVDLGVLYRNKTGEILNGYYLKQEAAYPDFTHDSINMSMWMRELSESLPTSRVNGFVLRDNWPVEENYVFSDDGHKFPYLTEDFNSSISRSISWEAMTSGSTPQLHISQHNQYGKSQVNAFKQYMDYEVLLTSSYDYGIQDAAVVQNVNISWTNLKRAITTTLHHSIFGNPLISIPVCGSTRHYGSVKDEELCIRWYIAAATFPMFRVSSDEPRRDPSNLETGFAREAALKALKTRYMLLPYYYTIISSGDPLTRPMFYDFYFDNETLELDEQYMLGNSLLVAQPVLTGAKYLWVYLPPSVEVWYEYWGGKEYRAAGWINMPIVETDWVMFIAQGHTVSLRNNKHPKVGSSSPDDTFGLAVALNCNASSCVSEGSLKLDSATLTFHANKTGVTVKNVIQAGNDIGCRSGRDQRIWPSFIENVIIYGLGETVVRSTFDKEDLCNVAGDEIYIEYLKNV